MTSKIIQKKRLGQVFLQDNNIINKMINAAHIQPQDHIVEIGCGEGILSEELVKQCRHLSIIELDLACLAQTQQRLSCFSNMTFHQSDVLKTDFFEKTTDFVRVIANIPYYISAKIVKLCIQHHQKIQDAILMVQKEFAHKLIATPNTSDYGSLTLYSHFYLQPEYLFDVSRHCFKPQPKVDSAVIRLIPRTVLPFLVNEPLFFALIRSAFWGRRKPLISALAQSPYLQLPMEFKSCPFFARNPNIRGETMNLEMFYELYLELKNELSETFNNLIGITK